MGGHEVPEIVFIHEVVVIVGIGVSRGEGAVLVCPGPGCVIVVNVIIVVIIVVVVSVGMQLSRNYTKQQYVAEISKLDDFSAEHMYAAMTIKPKGEGMTKLSNRVSSKVPCTVTN